MHVPFVPRSDWPTALLSSLSLRFCAPWLPLISSDPSLASLWTPVSPATAQTLSSFYLVLSLSTSTHAGLGDQQIRVEVVVGRI